MALLFPLVLVGLGVVAAAIAYWADSEFRGAGFAAGLFGGMVLGPLACIAYGTYVWLRTGVWGSVSIETTLVFIDKLGINVAFLSEPVSWRGVQAVSEWYLASNLGWTVFVISMTVLWFWLVVSERAERRKRK